MGDVKNLQSREAVEKLKQLVTEVNTCMFCTYAANNDLQTRPMASLKIDEAGNIWFMSDKSSKKNSEILSNGKVELLYSQPSKDNFLSVKGVAEVMQDKKMVDELWTPFAKVWFTEGKDDPRISVIKVKPDEAYYWDTKHGRMVEMVKMLASLVTGKTMDDGIEGTIKV
jgi:general stress protein 26